MFRDELMALAREEESRVLKFEAGVRAAATPSFWHTSVSPSTSDSDSHGGVDVFHLHMAE